MAIERKTAANNNGFPSTIYGGVDSADIGKLGSRVGGSGYQQEYTVEIEVEAGKPVLAADYADLMKNRLPEGYLVEASTFYCDETFDATVNVGVVQEADGAGAVAAALFTAVSPVAGTATPGVLLAPLDTILTQNYVHTIDVGAATAGKGRLVVKMVLA